MEQEGDGMTTEEFANVGVFVTALAGYLLGTGLIGCFGSDSKVEVGDEGFYVEAFYILAWLSGAIIFAIAVTAMRG